MVAVDTSVSYYGDAAWAASIVSERCECSVDYDPCGEVDAAAYTVPV